VKGKGLSKHKAMGMEEEATVMISYLPMVSVWFRHCLPGASCKKVVGHHPSLPSFPLPSVPLFFPLLSLFLPFLSLPLEVGPLIAARRSGGAL